MPSLALIGGSELLPGQALYYAAKRTTDLLIALVLLLVLLPVLLAVVAAIKVDSRGPILFSQQRMGSRRVRGDGATRWNLQTFRLYKFRSMVADADPLVHEELIAAYVSGRLNPSHGTRRSVKARDDERVTRLGRVLRKTSIDELPQLINVIRGEMSLVGPRPVPLYEFARYHHEHFQRFAALPGISGLWQVSGRCELSFEEMVACDLQYAASQSYWLDLKIIVRTIPAVLSARGAG